MQLHGGHGGHQLEKGARGHRVAHRNVDIFHLGRDAGEHRGEEGFIGQDHRALAVYLLYPLQDGADLLGLAGGGRDAYYVDGRHREAAGIQGEGLREVLHVPGHEEGTLVVFVAHPVAGKIPAELGQAGLLHAAQDRPFALAEGVQAHENELFHSGELPGQQVYGAVSLHLLCQRAVEHSGIGHPFFLQPLPETVVQRQEDVPDPEKLHGHPAAFRKVAGQAGNGLSLGIGQVFETVLQSLEIRYVRKQMIGMDEVFVYIVKISQQDIAPENEFIQRFGSRTDFAVAIVQFQQQAYPVRGRGSIHIRKERVHGVHAREESRTVSPGHCLGEETAKEYAAAAVREDKTAFVQVCCRIIVAGDLFQKRFHTLYILTR